MDEFSGSIVAMVATSVLLYLATAPKQDETVEEFANPTKLKGCFRYSHYHRKRLDASMSALSSISDCSSVASSRSDSTSDSVTSEISS
jgi:hypothetical protein